jgi:hypothetical protein
MANVPSASRVPATGSSEGKKTAGKTTAAATP